MNDRDDGVRTIGESDGDALGEAAGVAVGGTVGVAVGVAVDDAVAVAVGFGETVGVTVGFGETVGVTVGFGVGLCVGSGVDGNGVEGLADDPPPPPPWLPPAAAAMPPTASTPSKMSAVPPPPPPWLPDGEDVSVGPADPSGDGDGEGLLADGGVSAQCAAENGAGAGNDGKSGPNDGGGTATSVIPTCTFVALKNVNRTLVVVVRGGGCNVTIGVTVTPSVSILSEHEAIASVSSTTPEIDTCDAAITGCAFVIARSSATVQPFAIARRTRCEANIGGVAFLRNLLRGSRKKQRKTPPDKVFRGYGQK